jgi:predicted nucleotidyltransferase
MAYTIEDLAHVYGELAKRGVKAVVIGDTVVQVFLEYKKLEGDVDLFVLEPSPLVEREFYENLARELNWSISSTEIGTPALVVELREGHLVVELYENYMDIEIPVEIIESAGEIRVHGEKIPLIKPEHYLVLKARQGVDVNKLKKYISELKAKGVLNKKLIEQTIGLYPPGEQRVIAGRLEEAGLKL